MTTIYECPKCGHIYDPPVPAIEVRHVCPNAPVARRIVTLKKKEIAR